MDVGSTENLQQFNSTLIGTVYIIYVRPAVLCDGEACCCRHGDVGTVDS